MPAAAEWAHLIADAAANGTAFQGPATVYLSLVITTPSKTVAGTEVTAGNYGRKTFAQSGWTNDGAGSLSNTADVAWLTATVDYDDDILAVEAWSAATNGTRYWYLILATPKTIVAGQTPKFLAGDLVWSAT